ncbi:MAG: hypothetical protein Q8O37_05780 [Sulfuricellaceae bacterium]|nr:hypothetical protein [Sulfuricellaceae bacterium]
MFRLLSVAIAALALWGAVHIINDPISGYAKHHMQAILESLDQEIGQRSPVCVYDQVSFPLTVNNEQRRPGYSRNGVAHLAEFQFECKHCDKLLEAGLIKIGTMEIPVDGSTPTSYRYDLTSLGRAVYTKKKSPYPA